MQALVTNQTLQELTDPQRAALISLLADEDPAIHQLIRDKLLAYGSVAGEWLRPYLLSSDPVMRRRALEIVHRLGRVNCDERFLEFCMNHGEDLDLERGMSLLAQTQYPDMNHAAYVALFDLWSEQLRERLRLVSDGSEILGILNEFLFQELGFRGYESTCQNPENCYLNRVVDRRSGNAITMCVVYLLLARRLQLPITGIGLPGHFVCRFQTSTKECYIDVFRQGKLWTKADCIRHLLSTHHGIHDGYLAPISPRRILLRTCATLHQTYAHLEMTEEAGRVQRYLLALAK